MKIRFTKFSDSTGILGKKISLNPDGSGEVIKETVVSFSNGSFETLECSWGDFGSMLAGFSPNECAGIGVCSKEGLSKGRIVTAAREKKLKEKGADGGVASKTLGNFKWHEPPCPFYNLLMIDIDENIESVEGACAKLVSLFPHIEHLPGGIWAYASAGASIYKEESGECLNGISGLHVYALIPPGVGIAVVRDYFKLQAWLSGSARYDIAKHKFGCSVYERGYIDQSVFSPERLDFIGGSVCGPGLVQRRPAPVHFEFDGEVGGLSLGGLFQLDALAMAAASDLRDRAKAAAWEKAEEIKGRLRADGSGSGSDGSGAGGVGSIGDAIEQGNLLSSVSVRFDDGNEVPAWRLLFFPAAYNGKTMYDPLYPENGRCKAKFFANTGAPMIHTFVGGGRNFRIKADLTGVLDMIKKCEESELKALFGASGSGWAALVDLDAGSELGAVLERLKKKAVGNIGDMKAYVAAAANVVLREDMDEMLAEFNRRFAYVDVGDKPRILEEGTETEYRGVLLRSRGDFLAATEAVQVWAWRGGKKVQVPVAEEWLKWKGRRGYVGIEFAPDKEPGKYQIGAGGAESGWVYNKYKGLAVAPCVGGSVGGGFGCSGFYCGGVGCFKWFFDQVDSKGGQGQGQGQGHSGGPGLNSHKEDGRDGKDGRRICPYVGEGGGNWTYWLWTIYAAVCERNTYYCRWVVDWFCDLVQRPGGPRPAVSLTIRGGQGTGKGSIVWPFMQILGRSALHINAITDVTDRFNALMEECILLFADEAVWGGSIKESNKLKAIISENTINIEHKGINKYKARNFIRMYIASNSAWVVPAEDDERRYTVFNITKEFAKNYDWFVNKIKKNSLEELLAMALAWKIESNLNSNLDTEALREQKEHGWTVYDDFWNAALEENWFWNGEGKGQAVANKEVIAHFENGFQNGGMYRMTGQSFLRKFRAYLKGKGLRIVKGAKVRVGKQYENGFLMPDLCYIEKAENLENL